MFAPVIDFANVVLKGAPQLLHPVPGGVESMLLP